MAFDIEGKLYKKFETVQIKDTFKKREFVLEIQDGAYAQLIKFQLVQGNCEKLDPFEEGQDVKVTFSLRGREYTKDGQTSYFTNLDAWKLEGAGGGQGANPPVADATAFPGSADEPAAGTADIADDLPF